MDEHSKAASEEGYSVNAYSGVTTLKSRMGITGNADDTQLRILLDAASRAIDKYCGRHFYVKTATHYYQGASSDLYLDDHDLLAITTFKTDEDGDGTFENTLTENTDFYLYPLNEYPKIRAEVSPNGNYGGFGMGIKRGVQIVGSWGYGDGGSATPYFDSGATLTAFVSDPVVEVDVSSPFEAGQTILMDSEQLYISEISAGEQLTVTRAVNGTTSADHDAGTIVYIYQYPPEITEAAIMTAARLWKRKDSAYARVIASPEMGQIEVYKGMDDDIKMMLSQYRRVRVF